MLFGAALLLFDVGGLGGLVATAPQPMTTFIFLIGAVVAFAPVVLCSVLAMTLAEEESG